MRKDIYLGIRPGDLDGKPYARFWRPDMRPLPGHVMEAILHGPEAAELGLTLDQADQLMDPGYLPLETGSTRLANGQTLVAVLTEMPGVTGAMFEWWMGWHYMEAQRYKLWHPRAHVANRTAEMRGDDPALSDKEKYMTTHYVTEYIGEHLQHIAIKFVEPPTLLTRTGDFSANNVAALVCAKVELQRAPIVIGYLIHQIRHVEGGCEMRSRFWLGKPELRNARPGSLRNKILGSTLVSRVASPANMAHAMLVHCAMEMNHLASFLPDLYAEYHT
jgi:hypothetical protein